MQIGTMLAVGLVVTLGVGCASTPRSAPDAASKYKRVGVISVVGQTYFRQYVGLTVLGNELEKVDSSLWDIDPNYEEQALKEVATIGGVDAVRGTFARKDFMRIHDLNGPWNAPAFRGPNWQAIATPLKNYCSNNGVSAVMVVYAAESVDFLGGSNQSLQGMGSYARGIADWTRASTLHLVAYVALVDCDLGKPVAERWLSAVKDTSSGVLRGIPQTSIPAEVSRTPFDRLPAAEVDALKGKLLVLPSMAWAPTVQALFGR